MTKILKFFLIVCALWGCKKNSELQAITPDQEQGQPLSNEQINHFIQQQLLEKGSFDWKDATDEMVWSALINTDSIMSIGYLAENEASIDNKQSSIDITESEWRATKEKVLQIIFNEEKKRNAAIQFETLEVWKENNLPVLTTSRFFQTQKFHGIMVTTRSPRPGRSRQEQA